MRDEQKIRSELRSWIIDHAKSPIPGLADDAPILESGILSSLDIVEFVLFIENLRGSEVDTDAIEPEVFASVNAIYQAFFG